MNDLKDNLTEEQIKRKNRLKWRVAFSPSKWSRLRKSNVSDELEDDIITMLVMLYDNPYYVIDCNKDDLGIEKRVHRMMDLRIGDYHFWNTNYHYASGDFSFKDNQLGKRVRFNATRKISLALKDLVDKIQEVEEQESIKQAVDKNKRLIVDIVIDQTL